MIERHVTSLRFFVNKLPEWVDEHCSTRCWPDRGPRAHRPRPQLPRHLLGIALACCGRCRSTTVTSPACPSRWARRSPVPSPTAAVAHDERGRALERCRHLPIDTQIALELPATGGPR
ncbi:MAG: hypothetical protein U0168_21770 [Nannocystaceae bacterium]